jgi:ribose transport system ATP-binding protein
LISSDLTEMISLADRILVMRDYELVDNISNTKDYSTMSRAVMTAIHTV